jgi:hypothetical protein
MVEEEEQDLVQVFVVVLVVAETEQLDLQDVQHNLLNLVIVVFTDMEIQVALEQTPQQLQQAVVEAQVELVLNQELLMALVDQVALALIFHLIFLVYLYQTLAP